MYFYKGNNQISEKKFQGIIALAKELENLFTKFIAISELAEKAGIDERTAGSFALENQDLINERLNDLFIGSVANILSQNE